MIKNRKVKRMMVENNIEIQNVTLCLRLKQNILTLQKQVAEQQSIIEMLKRSKHNTQMNQMQIEIQHLNDENKRLMLIAEKCRSPEEQTTCKTNKNACTVKANMQNTFLPTVDAKVYGLIKQNEQLRRELVNLKLNEPKRKISLNNQGSALFQKNLRDLQRLTQKQMELEVEKNQAYQKIANLQRKLAEMGTVNCNLQRGLKDTGTKGEQKN